MRFWHFERRRGPAAAGTATLAVLAASSLVAGCGHEKRDFREQRLNPLVRRVDEERATFATLLRDSRAGRARDGVALRAQLARVVGVLRRIAALKPPDGVGAKFRRYVRANGAFASALRAFVDAFAAGDDGRQRTAAESTRTTLARVQRTQVDLQHALR